MRIVSIGTQIKQLSGLIGTNDLTDWEFNFVSDIVEKTQEGKVTGTLSELQVKTIEKIYGKHFV